MAVDFDVVRKRRNAGTLRKVQLILRIGRKVVGVFRSIADTIDTNLPSLDKLLTISPLNMAT